MTCTYTPTCVAVDVLVKEDEIVPVGIGLELRNIAIHRPLALFITQKDFRKSARELGRYFRQRQHVSRAGGKFHFEIVPEVVMEFLQRFNQQIVHWEPDRSAPVGI